MAWGSTLTLEPVAEIMPPLNNAFPTVSHLIPAKINNLPDGAGLKAESYKRRKEACIQALLKYPRIADAAKALDIDLRTLYRWKAKPDFIVAFNTAKKELMESASVKARERALSMMDVLVEVATDKNESGMARTAAAKTMLDYAIRFAASEDLEARVAALEKQATTYEPNSTDGQNSEVGTSESE